MSPQDWASLSFSWGTGIAFGVWPTGGHINPAVLSHLFIAKGV